MHRRKPDWLKIKLQGTKELGEVNKTLNRLSLHTVCEEAKCPNLMECFCKKTATFMILGNICTRNCAFCNVTHGETEPVDQQEPFRVADAVRRLNLRHVVITSVTRDDLPDGGAGHFNSVINEIRKLAGETSIEVLIPDFQGCEKGLLKVVEAKPDIINHNLETVLRLYPDVRPQADYNRSLGLLKKVKEMDAAIITKSGIMLGLGEEEQEVISLMLDLRDADCDLMTIGQYLAPSEKHYPVVDYIEPEVFNRYKDKGMSMGFKYVASAPLVRSSYNAAEALRLFFCK